MKEYMGNVVHHSSGKEATIPRMPFQLFIWVSASDAFAARDAELLWHLLLQYTHASKLLMMSLHGEMNNAICPIFQAAESPGKPTHKLKPLVSWPHAPASRSHVGLLLG